MNSGLYAACAGLLARSQALDVAANNLANVNTTGYKAQIPTFRALLASAGNNAAWDPIAQAVNDFGVLGGSRTDLVQGSLEHTGSDFDFALEGDGWFAVQAGASRVYTRNGNFHVDRNGRLVTADGGTVLGTQGPITLPPGKLSVSSDGTISVDGALAGRLTVVRLAAGTELEPAGNARFSAAAGSERGSDASVVQDALENSNVNGISAAVGLVGLQRHADLLQQALTAFHSNFNRIAAQDLSRI
ncbi:MAG TPA: flagellar hook basal-body protein [Candidatus Binatia bacterium]|nr:flagellar hook basal-body protein [Candidatus Binatia bacterium]